MKLREKIFDIYDLGFSRTDLMDTDENKTGFYTYKDPFDFYRRIEDSESYIPITQKGLRKAFGVGITGIEFFLEMATSLRPLADEAQDINEIAILLSQQKLTTNPNLHSISILRNLIRDPNPEIALYAAEGLNTIENTFLEKILQIKNKIKKKKGRDYILSYLLGLLYLEFARLLQGQELIQMFYLNEALTALKIANGLKNNNKRILISVSETYMLMKKNDKAIRILTQLHKKNEKDTDILLKLAECYYNEHNYEKVSELTALASETAVEPDEIFELIIHQWKQKI